LMWLAGSKEFHIGIRFAASLEAGPCKEAQDWTSTY